MERQVIGAWVGWLGAVAIAAGLLALCWGLAYFDTKRHMARLDAREARQAAWMAEAEARRAADRDQAQP